MDAPVGANDRARVAALSCRARPDRVGVVGDTSMDELAEGGIGVGRGTGCYLTCDRLGDGRVPRDMPGETEAFDEDSDVAVTRIGQGAELNPRRQRRIAATECDQAARARRQLKTRR